MEHHSYSAESGLPIRLPGIVAEMPGANLSVLLLHPLREGDLRGNHLPTMRDATGQGDDAAEDASDLVSESSALALADSGSAHLWEHGR